MTSAGLKYLKARAADKIARQEAATVVAGVRTNQDDDEAPRFHLLEIELKDGLKIEISGARPLMPLQASLIKAIDTVIRGRSGGDWTAKQFWEWARDFEGGFLGFTVGAKGDFADRIKKKMPWGKEYERRPLIVELKQKKPTFFKVVQLLPDRKSKEFEIFTGSYREIASLINNWWNQKQSKEGGRSNDRNSDVRMLSGHPKIYLYFEEDKQEGKRPKEGDISFRLMSETDATISVAFIKKIATKIKEIFGKREGYFWEKGKRYATYNHWELGYKLQLLSPSAAKGEKLIKDILAIQAHTFDPARMTYNQNQAEAKAFPSQPGKKRILGEEVALPQRRPDVRVRFRYASVEIGGLKQKIVIFSLDGNNPADPRFR